MSLILHIVIFILLSMVISSNITTKGRKYYTTEQKFIVAYRTDSRTLFIVLCVYGIHSDWRNYRNCPKIKKAASLRNPMFLRIAAFRYYELRNNLIVEAIYYLPFLLWY